MDLGGVVGTIAGAGVAAVVIGLLLLAGWMALWLWIAYTIMWRAVRRGMREFNASPVASLRQPAQNMRGPRDW